MKREVMMAAVAAVLAAGCGREAGDALENVKVSAQEAMANLGGDEARPLVVRKAELERRRRENTEWTAKNIAAHPDLYLEHCRTMLAELKSETAANQLSTRALIAKSERELAEAAKSAETAEAFLKEAAAKTGEGSEGFPVTLFGYHYTEGMFGEAVRKAAKTVAEAGATRARLENRKTTLERHLKQLEGEAARIEAEAKEIDTKLEQVKAGAGREAFASVKEKLGTLLDGMGAIEMDAPLPEAPKAEASVEDILGAYR